MYAEADINFQLEQHWQTAMFVAQRIELVKSFLTPVGARASFKQARIRRAKSFVSCLIILSLSRSINLHRPEIVTGLPVNCSCHQLM